MLEYSSCRITEHEEKKGLICVSFGFVLLLASFFVVLGNLICK